MYTSPMRLYWLIYDTIALISTTSQFAVKDHVQRYMILIVMYHDTNESSKGPPFKGSDFAIHFVSFVVSYNIDLIKPAEHFVCATLFLFQKRRGNQY
jgi:hypothetical protein